MQQRLFFFLSCITVSGFVMLSGATAFGQEADKPSTAVVLEKNAVNDVEQKLFEESVQPLFEKYCVRCHNADNMKSGVRVDQITAIPQDKQLFLLGGIKKQIADGNMPPEDEPQPSAELRQSTVEWITRTLDVARSRPSPRNGLIRRLTVQQYRNTLKDLLGIEEELADVLPPDGVSKDGFTNSVQTLSLSPLQLESYFDIAEKALDLCIVDENVKPVIQNFRMEFGASINPTPCPDNLILGANSELLNNADFVVTEPRPVKPFAYEPLVMRTAYDFIEGYAGNDTVRGWRKYDSIYHSVFACVRGTPGYPKGEAHRVISDGLLLRPAIPSPEIFGSSNTYGPMANFKISLRELPEQGNFRITVKAARYDDGLLLDAGAVIHQPEEPTGSVIVAYPSTQEATVTIGNEGIYQVDVACLPGKKQELLTLKLGNREFSGQLLETTSKSARAKAHATGEAAGQVDGDAETNENTTAFLLVRLAVGEMKLSAKLGDNSRLRRFVFSRVPDDSELAVRFMRFEQRTPTLGVYLGLRRDCGSTLTQVAKPTQVLKDGLHEYVFEGAIKNFPNPDVEKDNVNYLAGVREIGVRSEYTDGRDMPRLLVRSIDFEGPYFSTWPPEAHKNIFIDSSSSRESQDYATDVIRAFATRAFRRSVSATELDSLVAVWQNSFRASGDSRKAIKDALVVVLTSPQFLFLIENSAGPEPEDLEPDELASKLSYFLWNTTPDKRLLELASNNQLNASLDSEIDRMVHDHRFSQLMREFTSQWLSLDKFDVVDVDAKRYPKLTRDVKTQLRQEPINFVRYLIEQNLPVRNLIRSDFLIANEVVADYYDLGQLTENGFQFVPIKHENENLGGVLTHASILSGLSDGRESNPIKRGAWMARKIVAEPPDDPPPNVPQIKSDESSQLTLREKLERHRNQPGCAKCHSGIDPWGIPFELYDASGRMKTTPGIDAHSTLPDGTNVRDLNQLKAYLADDRIDQVAFSFMKHLACYAIGRSLTYNEIAYLKEHGVKLKANEYRMLDMLKFVIKSDLFLKK